MFGQCGKYLSPRLEVTLLRLFGEVGGLGEQLVMIILRKERFDSGYIEGAVSLTQFLDELQLGSASIHVDNSRRV